jgi:hypothetical protein
MSTRTLFNGASSKSSARRGTRSALLRSHLPASHLLKPASQPASLFSSYLPFLLLGCVIVLSNHQIITLLLVVASHLATSRPAREIDAYA